MRPKIHSKHMPLWTKEKADRVWDSEGETGSLQVVKAEPNGGNGFLRGPLGKVANWTLPLQCEGQHAKTPTGLPIPNSRQEREKVEGSF